MWKNLLKKSWVVFWICLVALATGWILEVFRAGTSVRWAWIHLDFTLFGTSFAFKLPPLIPVCMALVFVRACIANRPYYIKLPKEITVLCWPKFAHQREWLARLQSWKFPILKNWTKTARATWWYRRKREFALVVAASILTATYFVEQTRQSVIADYRAELNAALAYDPPVSTRVYDASGQEEICRFYLQNRDYIPIDQVPLMVQNAFIAAEDKNFREHDGIDLTGIARAYLHNRASGNVKQGGSTITQQVIKLVVLRNNERTIWRKVREVFLASELESRASKDKILEIYLNHVFLGRAYGIKAAAEEYYGKNVRDLNVGEAAFLAGMAKAPSSYSPSVNYDRAKERQIYVLGRMREQGFIDEEQKKTAQKAAAVVINNQRPLNQTSAPYFCEHLRRQLEREYGQDLMYNKGLVVYTTLNMKKQRVAQAKVKDELVNLERRLGFNGPEGKPDTAFTGVCKSYGEEVEDVSPEYTQVISNAGGKILVCARGNVFPMYAEDVARIQTWEKTNRQLTTGDNLTVRIITVDEKVSKNKKETHKVRYAISARRTGGAENPNVLQACAQLVDPNNGYLLAMVGGYSYDENQFNMCTQARRQAGSSFKPAVYTAYLQQGGTVTDEFSDSPICVVAASGKKCFKNYHDKYYGRITLATALKYSANSVAVKLILQLSIDRVIRTARQLGYVSPIERVVPIAVGAVEVTPYEHVYAYATLASLGRKMPHQCYHPGQKDCDENAGIFITKVQNADNGEVVYEYVPKAPEQAISSADAYAMISMMEGVTQAGGTGQRASELGRPVAGKTGTTNDNKDTWFLGCDPYVCGVVFVGRLRPIKISDEATGGSVALPIWLAIMKEVYSSTPLQGWLSFMNDLLYTPPREFSPPNDTVFVLGPDGKLIPYRRGTVPAKYLRNTTTPIVRESSKN